MMDQQTLTALLNLVCKLEPENLQMFFVLLIGTPLGMLTVLMVLYHFNDRRYQQILTQYRADIDRISKYYESNVALVNSYEKIADSLQDQVVLNTQTMQRMVDVCITNQFCPNARLPK